MLQPKKKPQMVKVKKSMLSETELSKATKDSTDYFTRKASDAVFQRGNQRNKDIANKLSPEQRKASDLSEVKNIQKYNEALYRQSKKGTAGYDKDGFKLN
jgi:hypothetical protein